MEARIARIESDVANLCTNVVEIKLDLRALRDRMDTRIDRLESRLDGRVDALESKLTWLISLQIGFAVSLLGVMARGFGWL